MLCTQRSVQTRVNEFECCKRIAICVTLVMDLGAKKDELLNQFSLKHFVLRVANILF